MALSQSEIYSLAKGAGLNDSRAKVAAAIAMAESGGNPNAHNQKPPDDSYGLWQINMIGSLGPSRRKAYGLKADSDLFNAGTNAKVMAQISSKGGNFSAWSTYTSGAYQKYANVDVKEDKSISDKIAGSFKDFLGGLPGAGAADNVVDGVQAAGTAVGYLEKGATWLSDSENWIRIAYVIGGSVVILVGINAIIQSTSAGRAVTGVATAVATKGVVK